MPRGPNYTGFPPASWVLLLMLCSWLTLAVAQTTTCPNFSDCVCYVNDDYDGGLDVDCSSRGLTEIPDFSNASIITLDLSNNSIEVVGRDQFESLISLKRLDISNNNIAVIGEAVFTGLRNLETLELQNNNITELEDGCFVNLATLMYIDLSYNYIKELRRAHFENLTSLTRLSLSENQLTLASLPRNVFHDGYFTLLDLSNNMLSAPPLEALASASQIGTLKLNNNSFSGLEANAFRGISGVVTLDLSYCSLTTENMSPLALDRDDLPLLRELLLDGNYFPTLNGTFFADFTRSLQLLSMCNCGITAIAPRTFRRLVGLATLLLSGNNFGELGRDSFHLVLLDVLDLSNSNITNIVRGALRTYINDFLYLDYNNITIIHSEDFKDLYRVRTIVLSHSNIHEIRGMPFAELDQLQELFLEYNHIRGEDLVAGALHGPSNLYLLDLTGNDLTQFPNFTGMGLPLLSEIHIAQNQITRLQQERLRNLYTLQVLVLKDNPLTEIEDDAFASCGHLTDLNLDYTKLTRLPNLAYVPLLESLHVSFSNLESLPLDLCETNPRLLILRASGNKIEVVPKFTGCRNLISLALDQNRIGAVTNETFAGMRRLNDIKLSYNDLEDLPEGVFRGVRNLHYLRLQHNKIRSLPDNVFADLQYLRELSLDFNNIGELRKDIFRSNTDLDELLLNNNDIDFIDSDAFPPNMSRLVHLDLSSNDFPFWRLPRGGFPVLRVLALENLFRLLQVPSPHEIPQIQRLYFTYSYHCCAWKDYVWDNALEPVPTRPTITLPPNIHTLDPFENPCPNEDLSEEDLAVIEELQRLFNITVAIQENCRYSVTGGEDIVGTSDDEAFQHIGGLSHRSAVTTPPWMPVECSPEPNPLTPCENLLDNQLLQVAIWVVLLVTIVGNAVLLVVMVITTAFYRKERSSNLFTCNLAFANFCLAFYLGSLAFAEKENHEDAFQSLLEWQLSPHCETAGFVAVFSSLLAIYFFLAIALELVAKTSCSLNLPRARVLKVAGILVVVVGGWILACVLALLPLVGINSYTSVAVCLPFLTERLPDRLYIGLIMTINLVFLLTIALSCIYVLYSLCIGKIPVEERKKVWLQSAKITIVGITMLISHIPIIIIAYAALDDKILLTTSDAKYLVVFLLPVQAIATPLILAGFSISKFLTHAIRRRRASFILTRNHKTANDYSLDTKSSGVSSEWSTNARAAFLGETISPDCSSDKENVIKPSNSSPEGSTCSSLSATSE